MEAAALGVLHEPGPQARPFAQKRLVGDLDRALVDGQQATLGEHRERPGGVGVALELELVERDPATDERLRLHVVARQPQQHRPRPALLGQRSGAGRPARRAGRPRPRRRRRRSYAWWRRVRPSRRCQSSSSAAESSGRPPGSPATSPTSAETSRGSTRSPARRAGSSIARRSSSRRIGPTRIWLALTSVESSVCSAQRP